MEMEGQGLPTSYICRAKGEGRRERRIRLVHVIICKVKKIALQFKMQISHNPEKNSYTVPRGSR